MLLLLLILIPLVTGIISFLWKSESVKGWALCSSLASLAVAILACFAVKENTLFLDYPWIASLGARFNLAADGTAALMVLLNALVFAITFITQWNKPVERMSQFMGYMLLAQAGLMGVFLANDLLLFYFFWELALIPVYLLASMWGGEKRIAASFKFFIYTFLGSLLMLAGVIYLYLHTETRSFDYDSILQAGQSLTAFQQQILFWFIFGAFAVKMPIFPFHTWQPDAYEQTAIPVTIVLSAVMVKMGLFATIKWLIPVLPQGVDFWSNTVIVLSLIGIVYASILAIVQNDIKRLVAYASIAHIGLMCLSLFTRNEIADNGVIIQMFNHGINVTGLWLLVAMVEKRYKTRDLRALGGLASAAPMIVIAMVIIAYANVALPLTNSFVGEFMMFHGIFESGIPYHMTYMIIAGSGIVLSAIYMLNMVQKVGYGTAKEGEVIENTKTNEAIGLWIIIAIILIVGIYPNIVFGIIG